MERRVLIAVFLSFLVLYGYQALFVPAPPEPTATTPQAAPQNAAPAAALPATVDAPPAAPPPAVAPAAVIVGDSAEREIVVETATAVATLTNRGGRIIHWRLKEYRDAAGEPVDLVPSALPSD